MNIKIEVIAIVLMVSFMGSITAILFFAGSNFPERTASVPSQGTYDTSFWNLTDAYDSNLDIFNHSSEVSTIQYENKTISLSEWYFDYFSESFRDRSVRINSVVISMENLSTPAPSILYLHGYGERYADFMPMLREFAAAGFIAMGIDQPGSGNSTGYPALDPFTFLNVTYGPQDSSLYHSVWAAARALTLLESMPQVRTDATIVAGDSMGGLVTFIISGIDSRVDGSIPMISAGNIKNSLTSGSLLNSVVEPEYRINSENMDNIIRWFDPLAYTRLLTKPVLYMFGTNDQFFPIISMMDTIQSIKADLTLNIVPNWGHGVVAQWSKEIISWVQRYFEDGEPLPQARISFYNHISFQGSAINIRVEAENADKVFLCWRSGEPGAVWFFSELRSKSNTPTNVFTADIVPLAAGKVLFYAIAMQDDSLRLSSRVFIGTAGSITFPLLLVLSCIGIILLLHFNMWKPMKVHIIREIPYIIGITTLSAGFLLPFIVIEGRAGLSVLGFLELYGESFLISGWFLPAVLSGICFVIALSAFRHRFQFRAAFLLWMPILVIVIILYLIFSGVYSFLGDIFTINTGIGAVALIIAIPIMQILDKIIKTYTNISKIDLFDE